MFNKNKNKNKNKSKKPPFIVHKCRVLIDSECSTSGIKNRLTPFLNESDIHRIEGKYLRGELKKGNSIIELKTTNGTWQVKNIGKRNGRYLWDLYFFSYYCILV